MSASTTTSSLARSSLVMAGGTLVSRVLGVVRYGALAWVLQNRTPAANAWDNANTLPNTIYLLLAAGVLNVVLLPQLTRAMTRGEEGKEYTDRLLTLAGALLVGGTVLFVAAAPLMVKIYAVDWAWDSPVMRLTIMFAYLCIPQILFYGLHTLLGQVLTAHQRFAAFMWSPALNNVVAIAGLIVFGLVYPDAAQVPPERWTLPMVLLLAVPATLGIAVQALVLIPAVRATGFTWRPRWGFRGVGLGSASRMTGWAFADVGTAQFGTLVAANIINWASQPGAMGGDPPPGRASYSYAFSAFILPHSIIAFSLLTAIYPVLAKAAAVDDRRSMAEQTARGLRLLGAVMVPVAVVMAVLAEPFLRVIYPTLNPADHHALAGILLAFLVGLVPYGVYLLCARVFYSFEDGRTPYVFQISITTVLLVVVALATTQPPHRVAMTVALGQALGQTTAALLGLRAVRRRLPWVGLRSVGMTFARALGAALLAAVPTAAIAWLVDRWVDQEVRPGAGEHPWMASWIEAVVLLALAGTTFVALYAVVAHLLGLRELADAASPLLRRLWLGSRFGAGETGDGAADTAARAGATVAGTSDAAGAAPAGDGDGVELLEASEVTLEPGPVADPSTLHTVAESADRSAVAPQVAAPTASAGGTLGWDDTPGGDRQDGKDTHMDGLGEGTVLGGRYVLRELLASREEGTLDYWSADDTTLDRLVAVTVLPTDDERTRPEAALDAARRVASVDDPRLVRVLDVGQEDNRAWIVEEGLSDAESLATLVEPGLLPAEEARRLVGEAAAGLESARRRGLHHLYLNPHSLLRTSDGGVKVSGVGVAAAMEGIEDITADEASLIDTADLVSLLYTGLTGRWPGEEVAGVEGARRLADGGLPAPSELVPGVPGDLDSLCRMVHGSTPDLASAPRTPGDLARLVSPWSSEPVLSTGPGRVGAAAAATTAAAAAAIGAAAADRGSDEDHTQVVPRATYYRAPEAEGTAADPVAVDWSPGHVREREAATAATGAVATGRTTLPEEPPRADGLPEDNASMTQTAVVMLVLLALVALAASLAWGALRNLDLGGGTDPVASTSSATGTGSDAKAGASGTTSGSKASGSKASGTSSATTSSTTKTSADESTPAVFAAAGAARVVGITSFDPQGDGDENSADAPLAVDGDEKTAWRSQTYLQPGWSGVKSGTGLVVDLGEGATLSTASVVLDELGPMDVRILLSDKASLSGATELATQQGATGTVKADPSEPTEGRYLIVWFDGAPVTEQGEQVGVREITVG